MKNWKIDKEYEIYGSFIWHLYELSSQCNIDISASNSTKLFYLITYIDYEGIVRNNKTILNSKAIAKCMNLSVSAFYKFINELLNKKIIYRYGEDGYQINDSYFRRGKLSRRTIAEKAEDNKYFTKVYIDGIRSLYQKVRIQQHSKLSMVFKILPYVNRKYNIICSNPLEENLDDILPLSPQEICKIVGYDDNHMYRLFNEIKDIRFSIKDKETTLLRFISDDLKETKNIMICVNPRVYYGGDMPEVVEILGGFEKE